MKTTNYDNIITSSAIDKKSAISLSQKDMELSFLLDERDSLVLEIENIEKELKVLNKNSRRAKSIGLRKWEIQARLKEIKVKKRPAYRQFSEFFVDIAKEKLKQDLLDEIWEIAMVKYKRNKILSGN